MHSCIYEGRVRHRRFSPKLHTFTYRLFFSYLDLDELESVFEKRWFWSINRPAIARFKRKDYYGDPEVSVKQAVYDRIEHETGKRPQGPVRLLTHLRYFGFVFNPVSFYYCFDKAGRNVETILAEITNTPWKERHSYVLHNNLNTNSKSHKQFNLKKEFHISPFMPMQMQYNWFFTPPAESLSVHMANSHDDKNIFDATLLLSRQSISSISCARVLATYPLMTLTVVFGIYWQALKLFIKRIPIYNHPNSENKGGAEQANRL